MTATWTYRVRIGGLMRCCIESVHLAMAERQRAGGKAPEEGEKVECRYADGVCSHGRMRFRDGAWEWDHPVEL